MNIVNNIFSILCDLVMKPFCTLSPWISLIWISLLVALLVLSVFKFFSVSANLHKTKNIVLARLLEFYLFKDDLSASPAILMRVFTSTARYMLAALKPLLILIIPMSLLLNQLDDWFHWQSLQNGDQNIITAYFNKNFDPKNADIALIPSDGLEIETVAFHAPDNNEIAWRFRVKNDTEPQWFDIAVGEQRYRKVVAVGKDMTEISPAKTILTSESSIRFIKIDYPKRHLTLNTKRINWMVALMCISMFFVFSIKHISHYWHH